MAKSTSNLNYACFRQAVADLLGSEQVQQMNSIPHHPGRTCYEHSVFVSYVAFRIARRLGWDYMACARAGLLHDLYLYDPRDKNAHPGNQCIDHPRFALRNAQALCGDLSEREQNAILSHMWPLSPRMPRCREALVVNVADKLCATAEVICLYRLMGMGEKLPAPACA